MKIQQDNIGKTSALVLLTVLIGLLGLQTGIFWDNLTFISAAGNVLYDNGIFAWGSVPTAKDSGHPLLTATYIVSAWHLLGRSLWVSHIVLWPVIFGVLWQLWRFCSYFTESGAGARVAAFCLLLCEPTFLAQLTLVGPEVPLMFFFLWALNGILYKDNIVKAVALAFLGIVSLRGMMLCGGLFLTDFCLFWKRREDKSFLWPYLVGAIPALAFLCWRLVTKGWIISNPLHVWGDATGYGSVPGFFKNMFFNLLVFGQRITDFGRIVPICFVLFALWHQKAWKDGKVRILLAVTCLSTFFVYTSSILIINPMGHRYFTVSYLSMLMLAFVLMQRYARKKLIYAVLALALVGGEFIVYPDKMAQGWDASLAQLNYWKLRRQAFGYMDENKIPIAETATFFPNRGASVDDVDLNGDKRCFAEFTGNEDYVFYSNVYNLSDEEIALLSGKYQSMVTYRHLGVRVELMRRKRGER
ncbi:MAG: hypothetical protein NC048_08780 [Bacteroides sp.]|nr:hypothetical protein [Ruminococcus flavefaciens]MCM1555573.1 hypothetical protein [Bacteroides sp.]